MMKVLKNTVYITTPESYLALEGEALAILQEDKKKRLLPLRENLEGIVYFGYRGASPALMGYCVENGISLSFLRPSGRFLAKVTGRTKGNVRLRQTQVLWQEDACHALPLAKKILVGKIYNARWVLERQTRETPLRVDVPRLKTQAAYLQDSIAEVLQAESLEQLRGFEGLAAKAYFSVFDELILHNKTQFPFHGRQRRPPRDRVNALLSFVYTLLGTDCASALETVGLDPYMGFLHRLRSGRASLALDLLEELRAPFADRFVLSLINRKMLTEKDFIQKETGAVELGDKGRDVLFRAWQDKKKDTLTHPYLKEKIPWGLVPYAQAMLLARYMRGDLDDYPPFLWK